MTTATPGSENAHSDAAKGNEADSQRDGQPSATGTPNSKDRTVKYNGKPVTVPEGKIDELIQKGLVLEKRLAQLPSERHLAEFAELKERMERDPAFKEAIKTAYQDPLRVVNALKIQPDVTPESDNDDDETPTPRARSNESRETIAELKARLERAEAKIATSELRTAQGDLRSTIDSELKTYPWVEGKAAALVRQQVNAQIAAGSTESPQALVAIAADEIRELLSEQAAKKVEAARQAKEFQTGSAARKGPMATPLPKMTKNSFKDGSLRTAAAQVAKHFLGD